MCASLLAQVNDEVSMREALAGQHAAQLAMEQQSRDEAQSHLQSLQDTVAKTQKQHDQLTKTHQDKVSDASWT